MLEHNLPLMLGTKVKGDESKGSCYEFVISLERFPFIADHRIGKNTIVVPGTAYVEIMFVTLQKELSQNFIMRDIAYQEALVLEEGDSYTIQAAVTKGQNDIRCQIRARKEGGFKTWMNLASCSAVPKDEFAKKTSSLKKLKERCENSYSGRDYYNSLKAWGYQFGPCHQGVTQISKCDDAAVGQVEFGKALNNQNFYIHPAYLDSCSHVILSLLPKIGEDEYYITIGKQEVTVYDTFPAKVWCYARPKTTTDPSLFIADLTIVDEASNVLAEINGYLLKKIPRSQFLPAKNENASKLIYQQCWIKKPLSECSNKRDSTAPSGLWLLLNDDKELEGYLADAIKGVGDECIQINSNQTEKFQQLFDDILQKNKLPLKGIVNLWGINGNQLWQEVTDADIVKIQEKHLYNLLSIVQTIAKTGAIQLKNFITFTKGVYSISSNALIPQLPYSPFVGLGKVIAQEYPDFHYRHVDMDPLSGIENTEVLFQELIAKDSEDQVAYRQSQRYVCRLKPAQRTDFSAEIPASDAYQLTTNNRGSLVLKDFNRRMPNENEVEVKIHANGLNFRDVLINLGEYPDKTGKLGLEAAGVVTNIGKGVNRFKKGDEVVVWAEGIFGNYCTVDTIWVAHKPKRLSFAEAATIPTVFLTAYYALHHLAKISKGDHVLIHSGAGGIGSAAIQLALMAGATVYATASPSKWKYVKSLGVKHVFNSRDLNFADDIMALTEGKGVDIVLNSLSGDYISTSFSILKEKGRFIEIGSRGIWDQKKVSTLGKEVFYYPLNLLHAAKENKKEFQSNFETIIELFNSGKLKPPLLKAYPIQQADQAFGFMLNARHIGKLAVIHEYIHKDEFRLYPEACYLITGGFGGIGMELADWLSDRGAGHIVLMDRMAPSDKAQKRIKQIKSKGVEIHVLKADVTSKDAIQQALEDLKRISLPLRGIIHTAGLTDDGMIIHQTKAQFDKVLAPKVQGSWFLHELTKSMHLDFFVMFSSVVSLFGMSGLSNYAAANSFLDGLSEYRRFQGLPAVSINWGPWNAGMTSALGTEGRKKWKSLGFEFLEISEAISVLEYILKTGGYHHVAVLPIQWDKFLSQYPDAQVPSLLKDINENLYDAERRGIKKEDSLFLRELKDAPVDKRAALLSGHIWTNLQQVLGETSSKIDNQRSFTELGINSLTAVVLKDKLQQNLNLTLPATLLFNYTTIDSLTEYLLTKKLGLEIGPAIEEPNRNTRSGEDIDRAVLKNLSDEEVANLLDEELSEFKDLLE